MCQFEKKPFWNFLKEKNSRLGDDPRRPTKTNSRLDHDWETWDFGWRKLGAWCKVGAKKLDFGRRKLGGGRRRLRYGRRDVKKGGVPAPVVLKG